ncbi:SDR family NAD(P)-dependent oxidoreductase [Aliagarivorans marinus]|uniref:SDR family NAD(P)-dependent oxidoreductase n=1 Tax=Aliagarivorans marinus TaxID=561965 RepID=UPI000402B7D3|nr:SDR family NAD(P)-dependent oxidoreductase [Aliagarivorans marinus]
MLTNLGNQLHIAVIGASGGLGQAVCELLEQQSEVAKIHRFARSPEHANAPCHSLDLCDESSIADAAQSLPARSLHAVVVCTGLLHSAAIQPEKRLAQIDGDKLATLFAVNASGPLLVAKHFTPLLDKSRPSVFMALSARVSSISDNRLGGWYGYRMSKAALNMGLKNLALEMRLAMPKLCVMGYHPGTVDTPLSAPFSGKAYKRFAPQQAAEYLVAQLSRVHPEQSGGLFDWQGEVIEP